MSGWLAGLALTPAAASLSAGAANRVVIGRAGRVAGVNSYPVGQSITAANSATAVVKPPDHQPDEVVTAHKAVIVQVTTARSAERHVAGTLGVWVFIKEPWS